MDSYQQPPPDGDLDKGPIFLTVTLITATIALVVVGLRVYVRTKIIRAVGWDDWMIILAMVSYS